MTIFNQVGIIKLFTNTSLLYYKQSLKFYHLLQFIIKFFFLKSAYRLIKRLLAMMVRSLLSMPCGNNLSVKGSNIRSV